MNGVTKLANVFRCCVALGKLPATGEDQAENKDDALAHRNRTRRTSGEGPATPDRLSRAEAPAVRRFFPHGGSEGSKILVFQVFRRKGFESRVREYLGRNSSKEAACLP
jgi:hypothetical protein